MLVSCRVLHGGKLKAENFFHQLQGGLSVLRAADWL